MPRADDEGVEPGGQRGGQERRAREADREADRRGGQLESLVSVPFRDGGGPLA